MNSLSPQDVCLELGKLLRKFEDGAIDEARHEIGVFSKKRMTAESLEVVEAIKNFMFRHNSVKMDEFITRINKEKENLKDYKKRQASFSATVNEKNKMIKALEGKLKMLEEKTIDTEDDKIS